PGQRLVRAVHRVPCGPAAREHAQRQAQLHRVLESEEGRRNRGRNHLLPGGRGAEARRRNGREWVDGRERGDGCDGRERGDGREWGDGRDGGVGRDWGNGGIGRDGRASRDAAGFNPRIATAVAAGQNTTALIAAPAPSQRGEGATNGPP